VSEPSAILVIDDEPWLSELVATALADVGLDVTAVRTAAEGLAALAQQPFAAIVCDVRLPGMDGLALYQTLAEQNPHALRHFGFYTAYDDEIAREFISRRQIPLLRKPCRLAELEEFVLRLLHR
jgi:CheY-like chemotaxis protein